MLRCVFRSGRAGSAQLVQHRDAATVVATATQMWRAASTRRGVVVDTLACFRAAGAFGGAGPAAANLPEYGWRRQLHATAARLNADGSGPVDDARSSFWVMGCDVSYDLDPSWLHAEYKRLQWAYHPDKYAMAEKNEQEDAASKSSLINKSYRTLKDPLSRGLHMLELAGNPVTEETHVDDMEFLMWLMEMNEAISDNESDQPELASLKAELDTLVEDIQVEISSAFGRGEVDDAKEKLIRLRYYDNCKRKIVDLLDVH